ncbi:uncharacterized protein B0H18DRAFT_343320 [Fomitopsis serialis]|uniref:uncharacterized protein n=1 Tax=Fomitopsis serialis TaxID=139415 RepID=UPI0020076D38|nr:uncharacterized protein B0H18DRAFT_343320 [Neoantrodia serialis]KAH9926467.1 hypothetical protein B0H18DRAFT_343320 [Neoantrodia serialis]
MTPGAILLGRLGVRLHPFLRASDHTTDCRDAAVTLVASSFASDLHGSRSAKQDPREFGRESLEALLAQLARSSPSVRWTALLSQRPDMSFILSSVHHRCGADSSAEGVHAEESIDPSTNRPDVFIVRTLRECTKPCQPVIRHVLNYSQYLLGRPLNRPLWQTDVRHSLGGREMYRSDVATAPKDICCRYCPSVNSRFPSANSWRLRLHCSGEVEPEAKALCTKYIKTLFASDVLDGIVAPNTVR